VSTDQRSPEQLVAAAMDSVGNQRDGDYNFGNVQQHLRDLRKKPGTAPLVSLLDSQAILRLDKAFARYDRAAEAYQRQAKRSGNLILGLLALAVAVSVVIMVWPIEDQRMESISRVASMCLVYAALLASLVIAWRTAKRDPHAQWSEHRGSAEFLRRHIFETVLDAPASASSGDLPPLLLKLEYFRRYQLDVQRNFHAVRGKQQERRAWLARILILPCLGMAIFWVGLMAMVLLGAWADNAALPSFVPDWVEQGLARLLQLEQYRLDQIGLIAAIALAIAYAVLHLRSLLDANLRNSKRYALALDNLNYLSQSDGGAPSELDEARRQAAAGNESAVLRFVGRVHSVMATEHAEWIRLRDLDRGTLTGALQT
jgi:hypothetical protein